MDEQKSTEASPEASPPPAEQSPPAPSGGSGNGSAATAPAPFAICDLQKLSTDQLDAFARKADIHLYPGRSRHFHILDIIKTALHRGGTVTAEGFVDEQGEAGPVLRSPRVNFLPVPEDVLVPRAFLQKFQLRPGQESRARCVCRAIAKSLLMLDEVTSIEGQPAEQWSEADRF